MVDAVPFRVLAPRKRPGRFAPIATLSLIVVVASGLESCAHGQPERATSSSQALAEPPTITNFVLYAQRSVTLGDHDQVIGGDVGVASVAPSSFGSQVVIGPFAAIDLTQTVLSPSTTLGAHAVAGDIDTNTLTNNGGILLAQAPYPASLPPLPLARPSSTSGSDVTVGAHGMTTLGPGTYGNLVVADHGALSLQAGAFSFSRISIGEHARVSGDPGGVSVQVAGTMAVGGWTIIAPSAGNAVDRLLIEVAGHDAAAPGPKAATLATHAQVTALLAAPHGTLAVADHVLAVGAFAAFDIAMADHVQIAFQSGFSHSAANPQGQQLIAGEVPPDIRAGTVPVVGPLPGTQLLRLTIGLPLTHQPDLDTLSAQLYDPSSPLFRKYIQPADFGNRFGATAQDYQNLVTFAQSHGFTILDTYPSRLLLAVTAPASVVEDAFFVSLNVYQRADGTTFYAPASDPSANLGVTVLHITGLDNFTVVQSADGSGPPQTSICNPASPNDYVGSDLRRAYLPCLPAATQGAGQSIALVEGASYRNSDISMYANTWLNGISPNVQPVQVPSGAAPFPPVDSNQIEVDLDIEMAMSIAPEATILVYEESSFFTATDFTQAAANADMILGQIAKENAAQVISCSLFWDGAVPNPNLQNIFLEYLVQGQSFFASSGDGGGYGLSTGLRPNEPIIDTPLITVVGGTQLTTGPLATPYTSETTWNDASGASGGGFAIGHTFFVNGLSVTYPTLPMPAYQNAVVASSTNTEVTNNPMNARMIPDVSIIASQLSIFQSSQGTTQADNCSFGTSASAPLWAAVAALANQDSPVGPLGFANPTLYRLAKTAYGTNFHDIHDMSNNNRSGVASDPWHAADGYDLATGLGSPQCALVANLHCGSDLSTDANNCGRCNRSCLGAACVAGQCQPIALATGVGPVKDIAVAGGTVCWDNDEVSGANPIGGAVTCMSVSGVAAPVGIFQGGQLAGGLTTDGTNVYFLQNLRGGLGLAEQAPVAGGSATQLLLLNPSSPSTLMTGIALNGTSLFFGAGGNLVEVPVGGGSVQTLAAGNVPGSSLSTAADASNVYWVNTHVWSALVAGGPALSLASAPNGAGGLAVDSTNIYWTDLSTSNVISVPIAGGSTTNLTPSQAPSANEEGIAVDGSGVYWATGNGGTVMKVPLGGGSAVTIASGSRPVGVALDDVSIYWTDSVLGAVMRIAK